MTTSAGTNAVGLLEGTTAIVTGAGGGVGFGIAMALAQHGANVVVAARRAENGEPAARAIRAVGATAVFVQCDVADRASIQATVDQTVATFGGLDCMVHNAVSAVGPPTEIQDIGPELWHGMLATAVRATFDCAQIAYPHLRAAQGSYLIVTSATGVEGSPYLPVYGMVKAAQRGFGKSLAREWGPLGIRVNMLGPVAMTPALEVAFVANPVLEQRLVGRTPLRRLGDPASDIGPAAVFFASDLARFVAGQTLMVDGGGFLGL
jgi:NAD(P)-dependent dehydrogenase (short-subunit alcohol dehydrogenase family)